MCGREAVDGECIDLSTSVCHLYEPTHSSFVIRHSRVCFARFQAAESSLLATARVKMSRYAEANPMPGRDGEVREGGKRAREDGQRQEREGQGRGQGHG